MLMYRLVRVECPASSANLGPGFDVFGLALDVAYDAVEVEVVEEASEPTIAEFRIVGRYADKVPQGENNLVYKLALTIMKELGLNLKVRITLDKNVKPRSGLGSSGASAAAITLALTTLAGINLEPTKIVELAAVGEELVTGSRHADNVAPSLLGGFIIIRRYNPLDLVRLDPPDNLGIVLLVPDVPLPEDKTRYARSVLPQQVPLSNVVHNVGHASYVVLGFALKNVKLIAKGIQDGDSIVEPARAKLIPAYEKIRKAAISSGALAVTISGAGPSMIAIYDREELSDRDAENIGKSMLEAIRQEGYEGEYFITRPSKGPKITKIET